MAGMKRSKSGGRVVCQIQPEWAQEAVSMTSASMEISFDQLRSIYQSLTDKAQERGAAADSAAVTITLLPKHISGTFRKKITDKPVTLSSLSKRTNKCRNHPLCDVIFYCVQKGQLSFSLRGPH